MYKSNEPELFKIEKRDSSDAATHSGRLSNPNMIKLKENYEQEDLLDIKKHVKYFYDHLLLNSDKRFNSGIMGFVSQFGSGKSFFLQYLYCLIFEKLNARNKNYPIYIDISKFEHSSEELLLLILTEIIRQLDLLENSDKKGITNIKKKMLNLMPKALKAVSIGALGILTGGKQDTLVSAIGEISEEFGIQILNSMSKEEEFLNELKDTIKNESKSSFLIILDNLDRCRPEFVLDLLVTLKRLLDVDGMTFLLSYDKRQIINLLQAQYGRNVDIQSYIKKYISYEYNMPQHVEKVHEFTIKSLKNDYTPQNPMYTIFEKNIETFDGLYVVLGLIGESLVGKNNKNISNISKFLLAYIWQHIFLNTTLSLRKFEQGFIHIRNIINKLNTVSDHVLFIQLLYIKFNFPAEYQSIHYMLDNFRTHVVPDKDFWTEMNGLYETLKMKFNAPSDGGSGFENLLEKKKNKFKGIYKILEGHK